MLENLVEKLQLEVRPVDRVLRAAQVLSGPARLTPSASNRQPLRYIYISPRPAPGFPASPGQASLPIGRGNEGATVHRNLSDISLNLKLMWMWCGPNHALGAAEKGYGGCMIGSSSGSASGGRRSENHDIELVIALGSLRKRCVLIGPKGYYWRIGRVRPQRSIQRISKYKTNRASP